MGLFGIGSKKKLEALWAICQKHSRTLSIGKMPSEEIVRLNITQMISDRLRINTDSAAIMQSTHNLDTFYSRLDLFNEHLDTLMEIEAVDASYFKAKPSSQKKKMEKAIEKEEVEMWDRCFDAQVKAYKDAKTDAGRAKAMKKHFDLAEKYAARLGNGAKKAIDKHMKTAIKKYGYGS